MNATEIKKELANARQNLNNALAHIQAVIIAADEKDSSWIESYKEAYQNDVETLTAKLHMSINYLTHDLQEAKVI